MAITYLAYLKTDQDLDLVNTLKAQERDHFLHSKNVERYAEMVKDGTLDQAHKDRLTELLGTEQLALVRVESALTQTQQQVGAASVDVPATLGRLQAMQDAAMGIVKA